MCLHRCWGQGCPCPFAISAQLPALYRRLRDSPGKRLILVGGSNVSFGVDTGLLERTLAQYGYEYTVCPFGLYAAVGASAMLEHTRRLCRITERTFDGAAQVKVYVPAEAYPLYRDGDGCEINLWSALLGRVFRY